MSNAAPLPILESLSEWGTFHPGLKRVEETLQALQNPYHRWPHILVGGTNGKGTVAATLAREWAHSVGGPVGLFLSPHVVDVRERITLWEATSSTGRWIPDSQWVEAHSTVIEAWPEVELSYFEWLSVLAVCLFDRLAVQAAVFEVGVGGRHDATNVLDPCLSVITNISLDHTSLLGNSIEEIAAHKFGIARPGRPFVFPAELLRNSEVRGLLEATGARLHPFEGGNRAAIEATLEAIELPALTEVPVALPGRREILEVGAGVYLDGAHNPAGWRSAVEWVQKLHGEAPIAVLGNLSTDRDPQIFLATLEPILKNFYLWDSATGRPERQLPADAWPGGPCRVTEADLPKLVAEPLLVCGSLYTVGAVRKALLRLPKDSP